MTELNLEEKHALRILGLPRVRVQMVPMQELFDEELALDGHGSID